MQDRAPIRLLITAGPTHEPIDRVRYLANRSSGRLGVALADEGAARGWSVTLLLGPTHHEPTSQAIATHRFSTTAELGALLDEHAPRCDALVMAAAVADYRPTPPPDADPKIKRSAAELVLRLEPTPDLLARAASRKRPDQLFIGFALEPRERMIESATSKLRRKGLDLIVVNPLETMDAPDIEATIITRPTSDQATQPEALAPMSKRAFARELIDRIARRFSHDTSPE